MTADLFPYGPKEGHMTVKQSGRSMTRVDLDDDLPFGNNKENIIYVSDTVEKQNNGFEK